MALQADLYNLLGKTETKVSLPKEYFGGEVNPTLIRQSVRVYLSNQRKAAAHAKTRGEVIGSTRKIYRQKGTGKARHGDLKAPIFVGGGKAHGPTGEQNYNLVFPKKMRIAALKSVLAQKLASKEIVCVEDLEKMKGKTKEMGKLIKMIPGKKFLLVLDKTSEPISRMGRNIENMIVTDVNNLCVYQILNSGTIIFTKDALEFKTKK